MSSGNFESGLFFDVRPSRRSRLDRVVQSRPFKAAVAGLTMVSLAACSALNLGKGIKTQEPLPSFSDTNAPRSSAEPLASATATTSSAERSSAANTTGATSSSGSAKTTAPGTTAALPPPAHPEGGVIVQPDQSRMSGSETFPVFSGYVLNLFNTPETDAQPLNDPNADAAAEPHIAFSGHAASKLIGFCFVDGGPVGSENRWATIDASSFVESGAVAASSRNVDYVSFAGLSGTSQLSQCDPHDYAHNPAGL